MEVYNASSQFLTICTEFKLQFQYKNNLNFNNIKFILKSQEREHLIKKEKRFNGIKEKK